MPKFSQIYLIYRKRRLRLNFDEHYNSSALHQRTESSVRAENTSPRDGRPLFHYKLFSVETGTFQVLPLETMG